MGIFLSAVFYLLSLPVTLSFRLVDGVEHALKKSIPAIQGLSPVLNYYLGQATLALKGALIGMIAAEIYALPFIWLLSRADFLAAMVVIGGVIGGLAAVTIMQRGAACPACQRSHSVNFVEYDYGYNAGPIRYYSCEACGHAWESEP